MKTGKQKIKFLHLLRLLIQLAFFIILPALYINAFSGIKQVYLSIIHNSFNFASLWPQIIEAVAIIPITILLGRFFCGWMCAFGTLGDLIYLASSKIFKVKFKMNEDVDRVLKYVKYIVLAFLVTVVWSFGIKAFSTSNPWDVFGIIATVGKAPDFGYAISTLTPAFIIFTIIVIGSFFIERFFCRYLCPLGAIFSIISKVRIAKLQKPSDKCGNCRICTKNCAMGIPLYKNDEIKSGECINCFKCISACPRKNVRLTVADEDLRPVIAGAMAVTVITGMYYAGSLTTSAKASSNTVSTSQDVNSSSSNKLYKDGTYEGSGEGFRGATTTVSVTVKSDKITDIQVVSYGDDRPFFSRAYPTVIDEILSEQSANVDAVSGATYSSNGIMSAVANALDNASSSLAVTTAVDNAQATTNTQSAVSSDTVSDTQSEASSSTQAASTTDAGVAPSTQSASANSQATKSATAAASSEATQSTTAAASSEAVQSTTAAASSEAAASSTAKSSNTNTKYKDGTYEGNGQGFRGATTTVSVTVKSDKITDVQIVSYGDDRPFFSRAYPTVIDEILSTQSTEVDAVSGATYSSNGIMSAVADALGNADLQGNVSMNTQSTTNIVG